MIQIVASGPDGEWETILHAFFTMITTATDHIYITTPYLIPDKSLLLALKTAALGGVDVRVVIPGKPDNKFVYYGTLSYVEELLEAGVKVYKYKRGFVHSKGLIIDGSIGTVGTANFDKRSFYLNFEVNAFVFDPEVVERLTRDFMDDLEDSNPIDLQEFQNRPSKQRLLESIARLFSPLL